MATGDYDNTEGDVVVEHRTAQKVQQPRLYRVILHNDDYTTRDFVVDILQSVFRKDEQEAVQIMLLVHTRGQGVAGVYTREIAETKIHIVTLLSREEEFPLRLTMEPETPDPDKDEAAS